MTRFRKSGRFKLDEPAFRDDDSVIQHQDSTPLVALATAHPANFPDAVEAATGIRPPLPDHLADLFEREERCTALPNELAAVQSFIMARARAPIGSMASKVRGEK